MRAFQLLNCAAQRIVIRIDLSGLGEIRQHLRILLRCVRNAITIGENPLLGNGGGPR